LMDKTVSGVRCKVLLEPNKVSADTIKMSIAGLIYNVSENPR